MNSKEVGGLLAIVGMTLAIGMILGASISHGPALNASNTTSNVVTVDSSDGWSMSCPQLQTALAYWKTQVNATTSAGDMNWSSEATAYAQTQFLYYSGIWNTRVSLYVLSYSVVHDSELECSP